MAAVASVFDPLLLSHVMGFLSYSELIGSCAAVSRAWLVEQVLDPGRDGDERTLDVHVSRLRRKLGDAGKKIATVWGVGYRLEEDA